MSVDASSAFNGNTHRRTPAKPTSSEYFTTEVPPLNDSPLADKTNPPFALHAPYVSAMPTAADAKLNVEWAHDTSSQMLDGTWQRFQNFVQSILSDQVTPLRLAGHISVLLVAATILILSQIDIPMWDLALPDGAANGAQSRVLAGTQSNVAAAGADSVATGNDSLQRAAVPFTIIPERGRQAVEEYQVQSGDTVLGIAEKFGLLPETIQWSNPGLEQNPDLLRIGDALNIPPVDGVLHTVAPGDTLSSLAGKYKSTIDAIIAFEGNQLSDAAAALPVGAEVLIPGGTKPFVAKQVVSYGGPVPSNAIKGSGSFTWPASGSITQRYWGGHPAIDVGSWTGSPVKAADSGYVVTAGGGWNAGYGNHVIVDHGNGYVTLYAHLNSIFVRPGESVARGQQLGTVGNTGNSTGPHLHFEIRYQGTPQNPFSYLP